MPWKQLAHIGRSFSQSGEMIEALNNMENYRSYIRSVLRMYVFMDAGLFDSDETDALREQMAEP